MDIKIRFQIFKNMNAMQHFDYECKANELESMEHVMSLGIQVDIDRVDKPGDRKRVQAVLWIELVT